MNIYVQRPVVSTTQAAEGLPRRSWTVADILKMMDAGIIQARERFELIGGEIVPMSPKGVPHETVKKDLSRFWFKAVPPDIDVITETTLYITDRDYLEPDFIFWPRSVGVKDLKPTDILLLVECADSSLSYDLGRKAAMYQALGIRDYWAIDAVRLITHVHRFGAGGTYGAPLVIPHTDVATPLLLPGLAVRLVDIGLLPMLE
jgi:Uma2 family endonuclease